MPSGIIQLLSFATGLTKMAAELRIQRSDDFSIRGLSMGNNISKEVLFSNAERFFIRSSAIRMAHGIDGAVVYESLLGPLGYYWVTDTGTARQLVKEFGYLWVHGKS